MSSIAERVKAEYAKQAARQKELKKTPDHPEAKRSARIAGAVFLIFGIAFTGLTYYFYVYEQEIHSLVLACMITFLGFGLWLLIFGKMPKGMKR